MEKVLWFGPVNHYLSVSVWELGLGKMQLYSDSGSLRGRHARPRNSRGVRCVRAVFLTVSCISLLLMTRVRIVSYERRIRGVYDINHVVPEGVLTDCFPREQLSCLSDDNALHEEDIFSC